MSSKLHCQMDYVLTLLESITLDVATPYRHAVKLGISKPITEFRYPRGNRIGNQGNYITHKKNINNKSLNPKMCVFGHVFNTRMATSMASKFTRKYPVVHKALTDLMCLYDPVFKFTTIQINKNTVAERHTDNTNVGVSYLLGLGEYKGGSTIVYSDKYDRTGKIHDIKHKFLLFNGSVSPHRSTPFTGTRYSLVFFNATISKKKNKIPKKCVKILKLPMTLVNMYLEKNLTVTIRQNNPKSGKSAVRYERYKSASTIRQVLKLGARKSDLQHDLQRGFVVVLDPQLRRELDHSMLKKI